MVCMLICTVLYVYGMCNICVHIYIHMYVCLSVCLYVCMFIHVFNDHKTNNVFGVSDSNNIFLQFAVYDRGF
jgi:O-antigen/teichoic acid export membrane protein